ncbi:MAG: class I SAM-dependent methyltransferase [Candidatus Krumholzibacteriia bacterium]
MVDSSYYKAKLAAERLLRCYELATPAVRRFLKAESDHVLGHIRAGDKVLELGCGYGRVLEDLLPGPQRLLVGIDNSPASLALGRRRLGKRPGVHLACMDAVRLAFPDRTFHQVCCIQNGISAFHVDQRALMVEAVRVTAPGGKVLFSSYAPEFWHERLEWFRLQAEYGLIGPLDEDATGDGTIVCRDGFTATTVGPARFAELSAGLGHGVSITTVEDCSIFCEVLT